MESKGKVKVERVKSQEIKETSQSQNRQIRRIEIIRKSSSKSNHRNLKSSVKSSNRRVNQVRQIVAIKVEIKSWSVKNRQIRHESLRIKQKSVVIIEIKIEIRQIKSNPSKSSVIKSQIKIKSVKSSRHRRNRQIIKNQITSKSKSKKSEN
jgi:hypothetical protein